MELQPHPLGPSIKLFIDTLYAFPPCLVDFFNRSNPLFMAFMASRRKAAAKPTDNHSVQPFLFLISPFPFKSPPSIPLCVSFSSWHIPFSSLFFSFSSFNIPFKLSLYLSFSSLYLNYYSFMYLYLLCIFFLSTNISLCLILSSFLIFASSYLFFLSHFFFFFYHPILFSLFLFMSGFLFFIFTFSLYISPYFFYISPFLHALYSLYLLLVLNRNTFS